MAALVDHLRPLGSGEAGPMWQWCARGSGGRAKSLLRNHVLVGDPLSLPDLFIRSERTKRNGKIGGPERDGCAFGFGGFQGFCGLLFFWRSAALARVPPWPGALYTTGGIVWCVCVYLGSGRSSRTPRARPEFGVDLGESVCGDRGATGPEGGAAKAHLPLRRRAGVSLVGIDTLLGRVRRSSQRARP
jgi:hypothetical protein